MTIEQKKRVLKRIAEIQNDIGILKKTRMEILENGYASATISTTGGSKSYSRIDVDKIAQTIAELQKELTGLRNVIDSGQGGFGRLIYTVYT